MKKEDHLGVWSQAGLRKHHYEQRASQVVLVVENPLASVGDLTDVGSTPGSGRSLREGHGKNTHSSILAWRIPWAEEPGGLQFIGSQRVGNDWSDLAHTHACTMNKAGGGDRIRVELFKILKKDAAKRTAFNMSADLKNSTVATGLEKVSFSNSKEEQCQRMFKLPYNCTHFTRYQGYVQNPSS